MKTLSYQIVKYMFMVLCFLKATSGHAQLNQQMLGANVFEDHSIYIHETIVVNFGILFPYSAYSSADIAAVENRLSASSAEIGNFFGQFYGPAIGGLITSFFQNYNNYALQMINAAKANNPILVQQVQSQWQNYGKAIADYLHVLNPLIDQNIARSLLVQMVNLDAEQILFDWVNIPNVPIEAFDQARFVANQAGSYFGLACSLQKKP
jgi:hypothetical protein